MLDREDLGGHRRVLRSTDGESSEVVVVESYYKRHPLHLMWSSRAHNPSPYRPKAGDMTKFVIISWPRSTTNSLVSALNENSFLECQFEAMSKDAVYANSWINASVAGRDANRSEFMRRMFEERNPLKPFEQAAGFKIFHDQVTKAEYDALIESSVVKKIVVRRKDLLSTYVSQQLSQFTGGWSRNEGKRRELQLHIDLGVYAEYQKLHDSWFEYAEKKAKRDPENWLFLWSEQLTVDSKAMEAIYGHLGVRVGTLLDYNPYRKKSLAEKVANYDEVATALNLPAALIREHMSNGGGGDGARSPPQGRWRNGTPAWTWVLLWTFAPVALGCVYPTHRLVNLLRLLVWSILPSRWCRKHQAGVMASEPAVTIQICCYNEADVIEATIDAACSVYWPRDKLRVEVLDDSTDMTSVIVERRCEHWRDQGIDIARRTRPDRVGYKAGNLAYHHKHLRTEFVAIYDADHRPHPDVLRAAMPYFFDETGAEALSVGLVQCPWGYYNRGTNLLTQCDALCLDTYFVVEQRVRPLSFDFLSFNGTGGIWRKRAIDAGGGWAWDTVTEDLDLSYRAFISGFKFRYVPSLVQELEVPAAILPYKSQKHRWTKGYAQVTVKSLRFYLMSALSFSAKIEACLQLTAPLQYMSTLWLVFWTPVLHYHRLFSLPAVVVTLYPVAAYVVLTLVTVLCKGEASYVGCLARFRFVVPTFSIAIGQSVQESVSFVEGLLSNDATFIRTLKDGGSGGLEKKNDEAVIPLTKVDLMTRDDDHQIVETPEIAAPGRCSPNCQTAAVKRTTTVLELVALAYVLSWAYIMLTDVRGHFDTYSAAILYANFTLLSTFGFSWMALGTLAAELKKRCCRPKLDA
ncbi:hypothetical protein CTAYLR_009449 [Chrysophaeum taylorii]|uniref:Glycosyltransferase 2-like domain-containing protein n=1 Tax=Chrysophaeum taylorii TaxID=2483200 RepID=A0AAD7U745_9STRA|nr:hypothetical protein CTAYLR_009449 [Chrysophaeum taylorii]